jgi:hypothetical protein
VHKLKSHKTVEQIAKKHRMEVSFIQKQLDMGEPIEHEHTKNHDLAKDIALQHLDEIPDYYTRLIKMERSAKKEHKKFKDVKEDLRNWFNPSHPEGGWRRYNTKGEAIGQCARKEGEPKPKCLSNEKAAKLRSQGGAKAIASAVRRKRSQDPVANRKGKGGKPKMVSNKIEEQSGMIRYCPKCQKNEMQSECKYGPSFWAMYSTPLMLTTNQMKFDIAQVHPANEQMSFNIGPQNPKKIRRQEKLDNIKKGTTIPIKTESKEMDHEYSMARSELSTIIKAAKRLQKKMKGEGEIEAWVQSKITKAADYIDTAADYLESGEHKVDEACWDGYEQRGMKKKGKRMVPNCVKEENKPTNPKLWAKWKSKAKAKFDVYPSAYANGWAAKGYKSEGGGWKSVSEGVSFDIGSGHKQAQKQAKIRNLATGTTNPNEKSAALRKLSGPSLPLADSYSNWRTDLGEDWQSVNRKDKTDGLSQKAVDAYRRENPGSKLQTAVTEKKPTGKRAKRRSNFCSRMKGMKSKLTSAKTSRDPDSRINKALRRWNCN